MRQEDGRRTEQKPLNRREFLERITMVTAGASAAGMGLLTSSQRAEAAEAVAEAVGKLPRIRLGSRMGNMEVSRILMSGDWNPALFAPALAMGANFIHKAHSFVQLPPEIAALPRESYYTDITVDSTPDRPDDADFAYNQVTRTLDRNGLKYYDIFRAHFGWKTVDAFKNQTGTYRAFQRLQKEGKVKHFGVSQHNWIPYPEIIQVLIDSGLIDSMQVFFHAGTAQENMDVFARASKAGIGMTAMKTVQQGRGHMERNPDLAKQLGAEGQMGKACVKWALTQTSPLTDNKPIFHCCVSSLGNLDMFQENMSAVAVKA